jgi:NAD(P)-dependent dehydrogenase (short-subunit alcohol dehydrogenase family)
VVLLLHPRSLVRRNAASARIVVSRVDVLVTGANRGLGRGFVRHYAREGDRVFACVRDPSSAHELARLAAESGEIHVAALDVADPGSIERAHATVRARTHSLDLLINNAGIWHPGTGRLEPGAADPQSLGNLTLEDGLDVLRVNALGPLLVAQRFLDLLGGRVIFISSGSGSLTRKTGGGSYYYSASKAALNMLVRALAGDGVAAVAMTPGWVRTRMGGDDASLSVEESVEAMAATIAGLTAADSGRFVDRFGEDVPW